MSQPADAREVLQLSLKAATDWRAKKDDRWELTNLNSAAKALLRIGVTEFHEPTAAVEFLKSAEAEQILQRAFHLNTKLLEQVRITLQPKAAVDHQLILSHMAILLGNKVLATNMLSTSRDHAVLKFCPLKPLWKEYTLGLTSLLDQETFTPTALEPKGYEKHYAPYLELIAVLSQHSNPDAAIAAVQRHFEERNKDARLIDWEMLDGDGKHPVNWDFRCIAIRQAAAH